MRPGGRRRARAAAAAARASGGGGGARAARRGAAPRVCVVEGGRADAEAERRRRACADFELAPLRPRRPRSLSETPYADGAAASALSALYPRLQPPRDAETIARLPLATLEARAGSNLRARLACAPMSPKGAYLFLYNAVLCAGWCARASARHRSPLAPLCPRPRRRR
jgi:hypothetical protein